jgi:hypothetical protein
MASSEPQNPSDQEVWLCLAELFFLDTEPDQSDFDHAAELVRTKGWTREYTEQLLVQNIAPCAGGNLGYLIYPVIGAWAGFDEKHMTEKISRHIDWRSTKPRWMFLFSDWWCRRILLHLGMNRLLDKLAPNDP